jgi:aryl-alcohol dehydrogenase-like predicted oxidoreductase
MQYIQIDPFKAKASRLVLGTMNITDPEGKEEDFKRLDAAVELGINVIDTAEGYGMGNTEVALGKWMDSRKNRSKLILVTKGAHPNFYRKRVTPFDVTSDLHNSLAKLKTDYIDLYFLHRDDLDKPVGIIMDCLNDLKKQGLILSYGASNWTTTRIAEANEYAKAHGYQPFTVSQPNYSLAQQYAEPFAPGCVSISGPENEKERAWYTKSQMPVFAYSSLAGGLFSGRITRELFEKHPEEIPQYCRVAYCGEENFTRIERARALAEKKNCSMPQIALAFVLTSDMNMFPIVGCANRAELESSIQALDIKLSSAERDWLDLKTNTL